MALRFAILAILGVRPSHGYALRSALDELIGDFWVVNQGQVYATLERLTTAELIAPLGAADDTGARRFQRIEPRGGDALSAWLARPSVEFGRKSELVARIALHARSEDLDRLRDLLAAHRRRCLSLAHSVRDSARRASNGPAGGSARCTALAHIEAELAWLDLLEQELLGPDCSPHP